MPKSVHYTLTWSTSRQTYELYEGQGNEALDLLPESPAWLARMSQLSSFAFHGKHGSYTARKERKLRGEGYWYAYVRIGGKLTKRYVGRSTELTLAHLEQIAQELWTYTQATLHQKEEGIVSRPQPSTSAPLGEDIFLPDELSKADALPPNSDDPSIDVQHENYLSRSMGKQNIQNTEQEHNVESRQIEVSSAISSLSIDTLLATKLLVPRLLTHLVHRPYLIQRLQQGLERKLTLISAPAGFGKSTLLADWVASRTFPVAWLSLEPQDNDLTRFFSCLLAALQTCDPCLGKTIQALLYPSPTISIESMLTLLLNGLQVCRPDKQERLVLVLDDYHVITDNSIHQALSYLVEHLPPQLHLVLSTREDPPLPLARLRGQDALMELRAADLQFMLEETTTFLTEVMELPLSMEESALLHRRTEGWITGLHLAVLSLLGHEDRAGSIASFSGSHHYVVDYLLEEVLSRQGQDIQDFLMQTSILDRLSGPLCDAVRAQDGSQSLLDSLERANLFLVSLDDKREWYRYHGLFAQVLRQRLQQTAPKLVQQLHLRASSWYEQQGFFADAVSHALAAPAFEEAVHLLEQHIGTFLSGSQLQTLSAWLKALPESLTQAHPALCLIQALVLMYTNHLEAAAAWLQMLERERQFTGQVLAGWGLLARLSGDLERCVVFSRQALELLLETETAPLTRLLRMEALFGAAHAYLVSGDVTPTNERRLTELVASTYTFTDYQLLTAKGFHLLVRLQQLQGQLLKAAATCEEVVQLIPNSEALLVPANGVAYYFGRGELLYEWNELETAEHALAQGMALSRGTALVDADQVWQGYRTLARLQMARGIYDLALATLDTFRQLGQQRRLAPALLAKCAALHAQAQLARGGLQAARQWVERYGPSATDVPSYLHEQEYLTMARIRIAEERINPTKSGLAEVLAMLELLRAQAEMSMRVRSKLEILLLLALVREKQGNYTGALTSLSEALALAEPEGYIRLFLDEGPPMMSLLRVAQRYGLAPEYIERLLKAADRQRAPYAPEQGPQSGCLLEPLTTREYDVLRLLRDGMSNREIADQLIVSVNTVKKHVRNICGKLNVQGRTQAIAKVQRLHLL